MLKKISSLFSQEYFIPFLMRLLLFLKMKVGSLFYAKFFFKCTKISVYPGAKICGTKYIHIGNNCSFGKNIWIDAVSKYAGEFFKPNLTIGNDFSCSDYVHITAIKQVKIGHGVLVGSKVLITDHSHGKYASLNQSTPDISPANRPLFFRGDVNIGDNVFIGDNVVIMGPANIENGAIIGSNSVITGFIPSNSIVVNDIKMRIAKKYSGISQEWVRENDEADS